MFCWRLHPSEGSGGNGPKHVSRAEQLKMEPRGDGTVRIAGVKTKRRARSGLGLGHMQTRGFFLDSFRPVQQRRDSLPDPGEEVQHRHGFLMTRTGVRQFAADDEGDIANARNVTLVDLILLKTFQKRSVSSPAPVTMASPSGDMACNKKVR